MAGCGGSVLRPAAVVGSGATSDRPVLLAGVPAFRCGGRWDLSIEHHAPKSLRWSGPERASDRLQRPRSAHSGERADGRWVAWAVIVHRPSHRRWPSTTARSTSRGKSPGGRSFSPCLRTMVSWCRARASWTRSTAWRFWRRPPRWACCSRHAPLSVPCRVELASVAVRWAHLVSRGSAATMIEVGW